MATLTWTSQPYISALHLIFILCFVPKLTPSRARHSSSGWDFSCVCSRRSKKRDLLLLVPACLSVARKESNHMDCHEEIWQTWLVGLTSIWCKIRINYSNEGSERTLRHFECSEKKKLKKGKDTGTFQWISK